MFCIHALKGYVPDDRFIRELVQLLGINSRSYMNLLNAWTEKKNHTKRLRTEGTKDDRTGKLVPGCNAAQLCTHKSGSQSEI